VGFGAGVTAGSFTQHSSINRIVVCEMEKLIPPHATEFFAEQNYNVMNDKRTEIHYDDARHYVLTTPEKFDIITSDPIHPWVKGAATLYSKEYFETVKEHLTPGGVITQWVPLYESDFDTVRSEIATFFEVFPNAAIFANNLDGEGYDVVLLARGDGSPIDLDSAQRRMSSEPKIAASLSEVGIASVMDLFGTFSGHAPGMREWLEGAQINRDLNLRLMYLAGMGSNYQQAPNIMREILRFREYPKGLFKGSEETLNVLRTRVF
jgi:spermidine synthase